MTNHVCLHQGCSHQFFGVGVDYGVKITPTPTPTPTPAFWKWHVSHLHLPHQIFGVAHLTPTPPTPSFWCGYLFFISLNYFK